MARFNATLGDIQVGDEVEFDCGCIILIDAVKRSPNGSLESYSRTRPHGILVCQYQHSQVGWRSAPDPIAPGLPVVINRVSQPAAPAPARYINFGGVLRPAIPEAWEGAQGLVQDEATKVATSDKVSSGGSLDERIAEARRRVGAPYFPQPRRQNGLR